MLQESDIIPYHLSHPIGERILVLAPHPDDETIGCGGTIRLLIQSKKSVKVVFLTSGDKADSSHKLSHVVYNEISPLRKGSEGGLLNGPHFTEYALLREKEAEKALRVLGVTDYEFPRFPDRGINDYYEDALEYLLGIMKAYKPDTIYSPSMIELNPDHRTAAALSLEILRRLTEHNTDMSIRVRLMFYEVTTPLRPNMLVDITSAYRRKKKAIKKYASQLKLMDYLKYITALNVFRALTVDGAGCVEAFWRTDTHLNTEDIVKWLSYQAGAQADLPNSSPRIVGV
jgi:LmbE family N-acetylglucosaminyl deacetylase